MVEESLSAPRIGFCMSFLPDEEGGAPDCWEGPALEARVRAYAQALVARTAPGDRVLLVSSAGPEEVSALLACFYTGRVAVPLPPPETGRAHRALSRIHSVIADATPALVVLGPSAEPHRALFGALPALTAADLEGPLERPLATRPDDLAILQYTSGSTSAPKGVMLGHRQLLANLEMMALRFGLGSTTPIVSWLPLFHDMGLIGHLLHALYVQAPFVSLTPQAFLRSPRCWLQALSTHRGAFSASPNFGYELCCRRHRPEDLQGIDLSAWRFAVSGGEVVSAGTLHRFEQLTARAGFSPAAWVPSYGLAEVCVAAACHSGGPPSPVVLDPQALREGTLRPAAVGRASLPHGPGLEGCDLRIIDPRSRRAAEPGTNGEIWIAGPHVAQGYWGRPGDEAFTATTADGEGPYLRTGDLGAMVDGALHILGRRKDLILIRGQNHHPIDIEASAEAVHPAVRRGGACAFAVEGSEEERLVLLVEVEAPAEALPALAEALRAAIAAEHGLYAQAIALVAPGSLAKTTSGKVARALNRAAWIEGRLSARFVDRGEATEAPAAAALSDAARRFLGRRRPQVAVSRHTRLVEDLGLDSLSIMELASLVETERGSRLSPRAVAAARTLGELLDAEPATDSRDDADLDALLTEALAHMPHLRVEVDAQQDRELVVGGRRMVDFASANYLGFDQHPDVLASVGPAIARWGVHPSWSRVVAAPRLYSEVEAALAQMVGAPHTLVFPTITLLHMGLLPLLSAGGGLLLLDAHAHSSLHEAAALAGAHGAVVEVFPHGNLAAAEAALRRHAHRPSRVLCVDGVYSMSGGMPDLLALRDLALRHNATIYVDDAHGFGVLGEDPSEDVPHGHRGNGLARWAGVDLARDPILYVGGLSKALSSLAAFITCRSAEERLRFHAASTAIFSGPCPIPSLATAKAAIDLCQGPVGEAARAHLLALTARLTDGARALGFQVDNTLYLPVVSVVVGSVPRLVAAARILWERGILITPAQSPAVPLDRSLLRFTVTALNTAAQVDEALAALAEVAAQSRP